MKQNDWIVIGVSGVILIGALIYSITQARTPEVPPPPTTVPTNKVDIPKTPINFRNGLPGASDQGSGGGDGGGGGPALSGAGGRKKGPIAAG